MAFTEQPFPCTSEQSTPYAVLRPILSNDHHRVQPSLCQGFFGIVEQQFWHSTRRHIMTSEVTECEDPIVACNETELCSTRVEVEVSRAVRWLVYVLGGKNLAYHRCKKPFESDFADTLKRGNDNKVISIVKVVGSTGDTWTIEKGWHVHDNGNASLDEKHEEDLSRCSKFQEYLSEWCAALEEKVCHA